MNYGEQLIELLNPRRSAYGSTTGISKTLNGKAKADSFTIKESLTAALVDAHLQDAANTIGFFPHHDETNIGFAGIDIDEYTDPDALRRDICSKVKRWRAPLIVARSKSGGLHVMYIPEKPCNAKKVRPILRQWAEAFGFPDVEIFPKQDTVTSESFGNFLNLMLAGILSGDLDRCVYDDNGEPITSIEATLVYIKSKQRDLLPPLMTDAPPCLQRHTLDGVADGERNIVLQAAAIYSRRAFGDDFKTELIDWNESHVSPPISNQQIGKTVGSNLKKDYQYQCDEVANSRYCNMTLCRKRTFGIDAGLPDGGVELPSGHFSYSDAATGIFTRFDGKLFVRGGEVVSVDNDKMKIVKSSRFQSLIEQLGPTYTRHKKATGKIVYQGALCPKLHAETMLESDVRKAVLKEIKLVSPVPLLNPDGSLMSSGFNDASGVFVTGDLVPQEFEFDAAVLVLLELLEDFLFLTEHDKSRAFAMMITPAFRMSGLFNVPIPMDYADAVESQSGKGTRLAITREIYGVHVPLDAERKKGIGSLDDSIALQFLEARGFIAIDNYRGKFNSPYVEAALTVPSGLIKVRVMRKDSLDVDISRQMLQFSSNDAQLTPDMTNRCCVVTIRKQPKDYTYTHTDILSHIAENRAKYLGACLSIAKHFVEHMKRGPGVGHDMRVWLGTMEPIIEKAGLAPLMTDHEAKKERLQKTGSNFLLAVLAHMNPTVEYTATELIDEVIDVKSIDWPEPVPKDEIGAKMKLGLMMKKTFDGVKADKHGLSRITIEGYTLNRIETTFKREKKGDLIPIKKYSIDGEYIEQETAY